MRVQDFMTPAPKTVDQGVSIETALEAMDEFGVRHLPVVEDDRLVGVISDRDLFGLTGWRGLGPASGTESQPKWVGDVMHREVVTVHPDDEAVAAAVEVSVHGIGCLPVIDGGKLVGIVSEMDLIRLVSERIASADKASGQEASPSLASLNLHRAITVSPTATFAQLDDLMCAKGIRHVPVVDGTRVVGMVSDRDMRRAAGAGLKAETQALEFMTASVVTVTEESSLADAAKTISDLSISGLIVTADDGSLRIVTTTDILDYALNAL